MPPRAGEPDQGHAGRSRFPDRQCRGRRDSHQATNTDTGTFLHHLEAGATGNQCKAIVEGRLALLVYPCADQFIECVMTADIFPNQFDAALAIAPGCTVGGAGLFLQGLVVPKLLRAR